MPFIAFGLRRAIVDKLMNKAFKTGITSGRFYNLMKSKGLGYAKSEMLSHWRAKFKIEAVKDAMKYVRKDRLPSSRIMAEESWKYDKEYVYRAKTWSRIHPEEPLTERHVTIQTDIPLTPTQIEEQVAISWPEWKKYEGEILETVQPTGFIHIVPKALETE